MERQNDDLPPFERLPNLLDEASDLPPELIKGILRCGHKMLISGPSKAGKSFLLMELAIAIAEGVKWLGFQCRKGRVLYVNLEIDRASCRERFRTIYEHMSVPEKLSHDISVWNLRGRAERLDDLVPKLVRRMKGQHFDAVIIDPIYKVITGDENCASDMALFCNQFDKICAATGSAAIFCHHHSKGVQGYKDAKDRASGSGVFARDPDALLDIIELELPEEQTDDALESGRTAWRMESTLREFRSIKPIEFWFVYPIHVLDGTKTLINANTKNGPKSKKAGANPGKTRAEWHRGIRNAYQACSMNDGKPIKVSDIATYMNCAERSVRDHLKEMPEEFRNDRGLITLVSSTS